jgi:hypothetical protein
MTIAAIKDAILALPEKERQELEDWLADQWDEKMCRDFSPSGRGSALIERVDASIDAGNYLPLRWRG